MTERLAIFVLYDKEGIFYEYVFSLIEELRTVSNRIICVINGKVKVQYHDRLIKECDDIVVRENVGFDAGAYKHILLDYLKDGELNQYDELIFCNDTFFGPFVPFKNIFNEMSDRVCDYWGIGYLSYGIFSHIQSYFLVFKQPIIEQALLSFFNNLQLNKIRAISDVCAYFELSIHYYLQQSGYKHESYVNEQDYNVYSDSFFSITKDGMPLLKKRALSPEFFNESSLSLVLKHINDNFSYNTQNIIDYAAEKYNLAINSNPGHICDGALPEKSRMKTDVSLQDITLFLNSVDEYYIYGFGILAKFLFNILGEKHKFMGFLVSAKEDSANEDTNNHVIQFNEVVLKNTSGVVVALNYKNSKEVHSVLRGVSNVFYIWEGLK